MEVETQVGFTSIRSPDSRRIPTQGFKTTIVLLFLIPKNHFNSLYHIKLLKNSSSTLFKTAKIEYVLQYQRQYQQF